MVRTKVLLVSVLAVLTLTACGYRDARSTAEEFVDAVNAGALAGRPGLMDPAAPKKQMGVLDELHERCTLDKKSIQIFPSGLTPQIERMIVVARCVDEMRLLGATVSGDTAAEDPDSDYTIDPGFLPGGADDGRFSREGLADDLKDLKSVQATTRP